MMKKGSVTMRWASTMPGAVPISPNWATSATMATPIAACGKNSGEKIASSSQVASFGAWRCV